MGGLTAWSRGMGGCVSRTGVWGAVTPQPLLQQLALPDQSCWVLGPTHGLMQVGSTVRGAAQSHGLGLTCYVSDHLKCTGSSWEVQRGRIEAPSWGGPPHLEVSPRACRQL